MAGKSFPYQWDANYQARIGLLPREDAGGHKFDGWSEAWIRHTFPVLSIVELLNLVYEDDITIKH